MDPGALAALDDLARSLTPPERVAERYDVVVVGSGAGGGTAAWKLAASGRRVLLVERAAWTGTAALARDHLRNPRSPSGLAGTGEPREPRSLLTPEGRSLHRPGDHRWGANAMTVGGGTRLYGAQAWRFAPDDFRMATRYGVPDGSALADWPIDHDDLEPYYDEAEWELGVSGRAGGDPWAGPRSRDYPMPPLPATAQVALLERGARALGLGTLPVPLLVNSRPRDGRPACVRCTQCVGFACPVGARGGSHTTALPRALATGACTVVTGARAERLVTDASGRVVAVALVGEVDGAGGGGSAGAPGRTWRRTVSCAEVVLAAGAVETARLLLASAHPGEPHGLGNDRDQVGRHLQGHVYGGATALFDDHDPDEVVDLLGPGPAIATCDLRHGNPGVVGGGMLANEFVPTPAHAFRWLVDGGFVPPHGPDAAAGLRALGRRLVRVVGPVQEVTGAASRVRLDPRATDRHGNAVAMLSGGVHAEDRRGQEFLSAQGRAVAAGRRGAPGAPGAAAAGVGGLGRAERRSAPGGHLPDGHRPRPLGRGPARAAVGARGGAGRRRVRARHQRRGEPRADGPRARAAHRRAPGHRAHPAPRQLPGVRPARSRATSSWGSVGTPAARKTSAPAASRTSTVGVEVTAAARARSTSAATSTSCTRRAGTSAPALASTARALRHGAQKADENSSTTTTASTRAGPQPFRAARGGRSQTR